MGQALGQAFAISILVVRKVSIFSTYILTLKYVIILNNSKRTSIEQKTIFRLLRWSMVEYKIRK